MSEELPQPGDTIGLRYRIEKLLGKGGMGAVFSAMNQATGRAVAIKWMLPGAARSRESVARFLAEARATAKIEHPNVIQILDVGQENDSPYLVMERLRGQSLADRLERGRLSVSEALRVIVPSCKGLSEAHSEGIIHRDIKPDNIFLCEGKDGSPRPPKVLDFGISKLYDQEGGVSLTQTGIAMGTPWYMSPEQLNAPPDADARFDVYAIGVVMYECLTGRPPYNAEGLFELVQQIAGGNPTPIRQLSPDVPPDLEAVTMRAMHANRDVRYGSMGELVAELERIEARIQSGAPAPAATAGNAYTPPGGGYPSQGYPPSQANAYPSQANYPPSQANAYPPSQANAAYPPSQANAYPSYGSPMTPAGTAAWQQPSGYGGPPGGPSPTGAYVPSMGVPIGGAAPASGRGAGMALFAVVGGVGFLLLAIVGVGIGFVAMSEESHDSNDPVANSDPDDDSETEESGSFLPDITPSNPRDPNIEVTFSGDCAPRFNARRMVTGGSGSVNVMSSSLGGLTGSVMLGLEGFTGTIQLSTQQRMDTQMAINVMVGQRLWTNMTIDITPVRNGRVPDPISGSITITSFDSDAATMDITFHNVTLQNMQDGTMCTLDGRLRTFGTTYGT